MTTILRWLKLATPRPEINRQLSDTPSIVWEFLGYRWVQTGIPGCAVALGLLFGGSFVCACLVVLGYVVSLI